MQNPAWSPGGVFFCPQLPSCCSQPITLTHQPPMPFTDPVAYTPAPPLRSAHLQMVIASLLRNPRGVLYQRQQLELPDGDFLSLDWLRGRRNDKLAILLHGLESSSYAPYMRGMVRALARRGWDCLVINARGCSGEPNRLLRAYHSGETCDPHHVIQHVRDAHDYNALALVGFSLGGNVALRYAAEHGRSLLNRVAAVVAVSAPCDLLSCARKLDMPANRIYTMRFLRTLVRKLEHKRTLFPEALDYEPILASRTFAEFDGLYTAPVHGFEGAVDYWTRCSSIHVLSEIAIPAILINAADDPFLTESCHPIQFARASSTFTLDLPAYGSHVGFVACNRLGEYWHESRICDYLEAQL